MIRGIHCCFTVFSLFLSLYSEVCYDFVLSLYSVTYPHFFKTGWVGVDLTLLVVLSRKSISLYCFLVHENFMTFLLSQFYHAL